MRPEDLRATLRPRGVYEGIDLGYALARNHWRPILKHWLRLVLPMFAAVWLVASSRPILALFLVWWLKPLWDRVPHYVISRTLFGEVPRTRDIARSLLSDGGLFWYLTIARFSWYRTFLMSIGALEGLHGSQASKRKSMLSRFGGGASFMLTIVGIIWESVVFFGTTVFVSLMVPDRPELHFDRMIDHLFASEPLGIYGWLLPTFYFISLTITEPLYVAGGFGLYINRRAQLEGWDIELTFRRLAQRLTGKLGRAALIVLAAAFIGLQPAPVSAQAALGDDPAEVIDEVLERDEFGGEVTRTRWRRRNAERHERRQRRRRGGSGLLSGLFGSLFEVMLWLGLAGLIGYGLYVLARYLQRRAPSRRGVRAAPERRVTAGVASTPAPPPKLTDAEVLRRSRELWGEGRFADAVGLLYHGATQRLAPDGESLEAFTETDWLGYTRQHLDAQRALVFRQLVDARVTTAYAHVEPAATLYDQLATDWRASFARGSL